MVTTPFVNNIPGYQPSFNSSRQYSMTGMCYNFSSYILFRKTIICIIQIQNLLSPWDFACNIERNKTSKLGT